MKCRTPVAAASALLGLFAGTAPARAQVPSSIVGIKCVVNGEIKVLPGKTECPGESTGTNAGSPNSTAPPPVEPTSPSDADFLKPKPSTPPAAEQHVPTHPDAVDLQQLDTIKLKGAPNAQTAYSSDAVGGNSLGGVTLKDSGVEQATGTVSTAWKHSWAQLQCSASILGFAVPKALSARVEADLQEIRYLDEQAIQAATGGKVEVDCGQPTPFPAIQLHALPPLTDFAPRAAQHTLEMTKHIDEDATTLVRVDTELPAAKQQTEAAKAKVDTLNDQIDALRLKPADAAGSQALNQATFDLNEAKAAYQKALDAQQVLQSARDQARTDLTQQKASNDKVVSSDQSQVQAAFDDIMGNGDDRNKP